MTTRVKVIDVDGLMERLTARQGWNLSSQLRIALDFIDGVAERGAFERYLESRAAEENQEEFDETVDEASLPHVLTVITANNLGTGILCESSDEALRAARIWYALRRRLTANDDHELEEGPDPQTATLEEINDWYSEGDAGFGIAITPVISTTSRSVAEKLVHAEVDAMDAATPNKEELRRELESVAGEL